MRRPWILALPLMLVVLTGCELLLDEPTIRVTEVQAASLGLTGGTLRLHLEVENPNGFSLSADGFAYRFDIARDPPEDVWTTLLEGSYEEAVELPADGSTQMTMEVPFEYGDVGAAMGRLLRRGEVEYRFSGLFRFRILVGGVNVPFDQQGTFRP